MVFKKVIHFLFSSFFQILAGRGEDVTIEQLFLAALEKAGFTKAEDPCFVQSFELDTIQVTWKWYYCCFWCY